jgi:hypothetical protein
MGESACVAVADEGLAQSAGGRLVLGPQLAALLALGLAVALGLPLVAFMIPALQFSGWEWVAFALATPIVLVSGYPFHRAAVRAARHRGATMDTLVSIGTLSAWAWSVAVLFGGVDEHTYFEVAGIVTTLILLGRWLEARARRRSGASIRALAELGAREARVLRDGVETAVPAELLAVALAFLFGYTLTSVPLVRAGLPLATVAALAFASDTFSIAVMEIVDNAILLVIPGAMEAGLGDALFWGSLAFALAIAFVAAFPVNRWLIARGRGHAVVHAHHHG